MFRPELDRSIDVDRAVTHSIFFLLILEGDKRYLTQRVMTVNYRNESVTFPQLKCQGYILLNLFLHGLVSAALEKSVLLKLHRGQAIRLRQPVFRHS